MYQDEKPLASPQSSLPSLSFSHISGFASSSSSVSSRSSSTSPAESSRQANAPFRLPVKQDVKSHDWSLRVDIGQNNQEHGEFVDIDSAELHGALTEARVDISSPTALNRQHTDSKRQGQETLASQLEHSVAEDRTSSPEDVSAATKSPKWTTQQWSIRKIKGVRTYRGKKQYLVSWEDTWEPMGGLHKAQESITKFEARRMRKGGFGEAAREPKRARP